ncbi:MAG: hypothetical protein F6J93_15215 [Oscillatoria sp. SIO1A7]|nr:hypothetical protein [Oscillatoria sp. SIO1A7]
MPLQILDMDSLRKSCLESPVGRASRLSPSVPRDRRDARPTGDLTFLERLTGFEIRSEGSEWQGKR